MSSLDLSAPLTILPSVSVEQAIDIMVREGFDQLPVITESGKIVGVASLGSLKAKLLKVLTRGQYSDQSLEENRSFSKSFHSAEEYSSLELTISFEMCFQKLIIFKSQTI